MTIVTKICKIRTFLHGNSVPPMLRTEDNNVVSHIMHSSCIICHFVFIFYLLQANKVWVVNMITLNPQTEHTYQLAQMFGQLGEITALLYLRPLTTGISRDQNKKFDLVQKTQTPCPSYHICRIKLNFLLNLLVWIASLVVVDCSKYSETTPLMMI